MIRRIIIFVFSALLSLVAYADSKPYAVLSRDGKTVTFYYDEQKEIRDGIEINSKRLVSGESPYGSAITVIIDASFDNYYPTSTAHWFEFCTSLVSIIGMEHLNTDNVIDMYEMFAGCHSLTSLDVSGFKTDNVTNMSGMFGGCESLQTLDVSGFKTDNVTNMSGMFEGCESLQTLDVSGFKTDNVTNMSGMFSSCHSLTSLDVSGFKTGNVTNMSAMFYNCYSLTSLDVSGFKTDNVTNMSGMFEGCFSLLTLDLSNFDTSKVIDMHNMFDFCQVKSIDLSSFDTSNVKNMSYMFKQCHNLENLDLSNFDTGNVTNMSHMFESCNSLLSLDVSSFDTGNVTDMNHMFDNCNNLSTLDVSSFDTGNVTNMKGLFASCSGLNSLNLSNFNTGNVTDMSFMFSSCKKLQALDLSNFRTDNVTTMSYMFRVCWELTSLNLKSFNTSDVVKMDNMFYACLKLPSIDLSSFETRNVTDMSCMFEYCGELETIFVSEDKWSTDNVSVGYLMFNKCTNLKGGNGTKYDARHIGFEYARIDEGTTSPGYLTGGSGSSSNPDTPEDPGNPDVQDVEPSTPVIGTKKLLSVTRVRGTQTERGEISYDAEGRVSKFSISEESSTRSTSKTVFNYHYSDNAINIYREGHGDIYTFSIENGRVNYSASSEEGIYSDNSTYTYNSDKRLVKLTTLSSETGSNVIHDEAYFTWADGNLSSIVSYSGIEGSTLEEDMNISVLYNNLMSEPLMHVWFGLMNLPNDMLASRFNTLAIYPYLGTLPENLFSEYSYTDEYEDGRLYDYKFNYETNSDGDIVKVTIEEGNSSTVFTFAWEGSSNNPNNPDNPSISGTFTVGDLTYIKMEGSNVFVKAANTNISGSVQIPSMVRNDGTMYSVTGIAESGFEGCTGITSLTIPSSIMSIGDKGFFGCSGLAEMKVNIEVPISISESVFSGVDKTMCVLNVPEGCGNEYREATGWKDFWLVAAAGETIVNGITYEVKTDGKATIISANHSADGRYVIPSTVIIDDVEHVVTGIASNAFYGCTDMTAVTIPESITTIGDYAFAGCENLMEVYCESTMPIDLSRAFSRNIGHRARVNLTQFEGIDFEKCVLYVPYGAEEAYREAEGWKLFTHIVGVHSEKDPVAVVTAKSYSREYGEENPAFEFTVEGAPLDGEPVIECAATTASDAGEYDINIKKGTVKNYNDSYVSGKLTITKAPLKVSVKDAEREQGTENPQFEIVYEGWKLTDTESVLTKKPTATTTATKDSPAGEYDITVSGAEAKNYELSYTSGKLTVLESSGISSILTDGSAVDIFTTTGVLVKKDATTLKGLKKGVYIVNGRKVVVK